MPYEGCGPAALRSVYLSSWARLSGGWLHLVTSRCNAMGCWRWIAGLGCPAAVLPNTAGLGVVDRWEGSASD